ncbi:MAG: hypothetical protein JO117_01800 [Verrucomicrobia bacterium]|nr:hypothetical protein [Verrucomicrobiota bacterium]MBV9657545.1 hypothetical protein [Verrucomicrobiota bacterium]
MNPKIFVYWVLVCIPLGWGVYNSVLKSLPLFGVQPATATAPAKGLTAKREAPGAPTPATSAPASTPMQTAAPSSAVTPSSAAATDITPAAAPPVPTATP